MEKMGGKPAEVPERKVTVIPAMFKPKMAKTQNKKFKRTFTETRKWKMKKITELTR